MADKQVKGAMIGLGFGAEFIPIYQQHPNAEIYAICQRESFDVYGTKKSFEWALVEGEQHVIHTAKKPEHEIPTKVEVPDYAHRLPAEIQKFTQSIEDAEHLSFVQGGGHGGSHPHLVNEFVRALVDNRDPWPNAVTSANWTCVGICAHESSKKSGEIVRLPDFTLAR